MVRTKVKVGEKGQIVIPKIIRDHLGLVENHEVLLEVRDKILEIKAMPEQDFVKKMEERAKKSGGNVSKWVYGDKLYKEAFG
ncbi:MAG: AbrB/MazE/SpoVT family DNA-binding domain-containing protein [Candidatus Aenigmarchaeota archaeon]|nr:AbrB/MazE/SpoVT family DNA-binding domain-containing protein [Candidatus Aenigmarchaeota archaeon]